IRRIVLFAALVVAATPLAAQTVRGRVLDAASGEGIAEVAVQALGADGHDVGRARTAADGSFVLQLRAAASVRIQAQRTGYRTTLTAALPVAPSEAVEVPKRRNLELNGFYERERMGIGKYVRREEIELRPSQNLAQVLQRVQGTAIHYQGSKQYIYFPRNGRPRLNQSFRGPPENACLPRLYVDGARVTYDANNDINAVVNPGQVEAIELFRGP